MPQGRKTTSCSTKQDSPSDPRVDRYPQRALVFNIYFNFLLITAAHFIQDTGTKFKFIPVNRSPPFSAGNNRIKYRMCRNTKTLSRIRFFLFLRSSVGQSQLFTTWRITFLAVRVHTQGRRRDKALEDIGFASALSQRNCFEPK